MANLPFLNRKRKETGIIVQERAPDMPEEPGLEDDGLKAAAEDILRAISDNDSQHLALALRAAFEIMEASPHKEGPHIEEENE